MKNIFPTELMVFMVVYNVKIFMLFKINFKE